MEVSYCYSYFFLPLHCGVNECKPKGGRAVVSASLGIMVARSREIEVRPLPTGTLFFPFAHSGDAQWCLVVAYSS